MLFDLNEVHAEPAVATLILALAALILIWLTRSLRNRAEHSKHVKDASEVATPATGVTSAAQSAVSLSVAPAPTQTPAPSQSVGKTPVAAPAPAPSYTAIAIAALEGKPVPARQAPVAPAVAPDYTGASTTVPRDASYTAIAVATAAAILRGEKLTIVEPTAVSVAAPSARGDSYAAIAIAALEASGRVPPPPSEAPAEEPSAKIDYSGEPPTVPPDASYTAIAVAAARQAAGRAVA